MLTANLEADSYAASTEPLMTDRHILHEFMTRYPSTPKQEIRQLVFLVVALLVFTLAMAACLFI
jgi:hypothetical protein